MIVHAIPSLVKTYWWIDCNNVTNYIIIGNEGKGRLQVTMALHRTASPLFNH